jgi:hypothetical protein
MHHGPGGQRGLKAFYDTIFARQNAGVRFWHLHGHSSQTEIGKKI